MRKILLLLIAVCCFNQTMNGQKKIRTEKDIKDYLDFVSKDITTNPQKPVITEDVPNVENEYDKKKSKKGILLSEPTLNNIFSKKMAYFLSGDNDISTFKNYFTASSKDKSVSVGYNFVNPGSPKDDFQRLKTIASIGVKGSLGTFLQEKSIPSDIGLNANITIIGRGSVFFNPELNTTLQRKRNYFNKNLQADLDEKLKQFDDLNNGLSSGDVVVSNLIAKKRKELENSLYKKLRESFSEQEEEAANYNFIVTKWFTPTLYLPFNTTKYNMASSNGGKIDTLEYYPINMGVTLGYFKQWKENPSFLKPSILFTLSVSAINTNPITIFDTYGNISNRDTVASKLGLKKVKINDTQVYQGNGDSYFDFNLKPRLLLSWSKSVASLDLFANLSYSKYSHHDAGFGVLFSLPDKDGKKPINIEPTFTIRDIGNNLIQDKNWFDKLLVGVSISLPFNSLVF